MTNSNCTCKLFLGLDLTSCIQAADDSNGTDSPAEHSALSEIVSLVLDSRLKISLGKKSLQQIQAKSSDFILNPEMYVYRREKYIYCLLEESTCFPFFKVKSISLIFCCFFSYMYYIQSMQTGKIFWDKGLILGHKIVPHRRVQCSRGENK